MGQNPMFIRLGDSWVGPEALTPPDPHTFPITSSGDLPDVVKSLAAFRAGDQERVGDRPTTFVPVEDGGKGTLILEVYKDDGTRVVEQG